MKEKLLSCLLMVCMMSVIITAMQITVNSETSGIYTYEIINGEAMITDCDSAASGSILIPSTLGGYPVTSIDDYAFYLCENLINIIIPDSVISIGDDAFSSCINLTDITIPDSLTKINGYAFYNCTRLTNVYINDLNAWCKIAFQNYYANPLSNGANLYLNNRLITELIIPYGISSIGNFAFEGCSGLTSVLIPESVVSIGYGAFTGCSSLTNVAISENVTIISDYAFQGCKSLANITIPNGVTSIRNGVFSSCESLTSITISDNVTNIGVDAFYGCSNLTSITIPENVISIGYSAFCECISLKSITIPDSVTNIGVDAFYNTAYYNNKSNWENGVLYIGNHLIRANNDLSGEYEVKAGTISIGDWAFRASYNMTNINITNIKVPDSVIRIGDYAFYNCTSLKSIEISGNVKSIGIGAFYNTEYYNNKSNWENNVLYINKYLIAVDIINLTGEYSIKYGTEVIAESAFSSCWNLTGITIPDSVIIIGKGVFSFCESLENIYVEEDNPKYSEINGVLYNKEKTAIITYPAGKTNKTYIIPDSVTRIGYNAFLGSKTLESVIIPSSVTIIEECAFSSCASLTSIIIPDSITRIGEGVFDSCTRLKSVTIPNSVTSIANGAFINCTNLTDIYYTGSKEQWSNVIIGMDEGYVLEANIHYALKINLNYSINDGGDIWKTLKVNIDSDVLLTNEVPSRTGYTFLGWAKAADMSEAEYQPGEAITVGMKDITLYAVWEKTSYTTTTKINGIYIITPAGIPEGNSIMLACYKDGTLAYIGKFEYDNSAVIPFYANEVYDEIKVFVWDFENMIPITEPETVM